MANPTLDELKAKLLEISTTNDDPDLGSVARSLQMDDNGNAYVDLYGLQAQNLAPAVADYYSKTYGGFSVSGKTPSIDEFAERYKDLYNGDVSEARANYADIQKNLSKSLNSGYDSKKVIEKDGIRYFQMKDGSVGRLDPVNPTIILPSMWGGQNKRGDVLPAEVSVINEADWTKEFRQLGVRTNFSDRSKEELAEMRGVYVKYGAKPTFKDVMEVDENGNQRMVKKLDVKNYYGDLDDAKRQYDKGGWWGGRGSFVDDDGNVSTLINTTDDADGAPVWKAVSADAAIASDVVRSMYGPRQKKSNTSHLFDSFYNALSSAKGAAAGTLPQTFGALGEWAFGEGGISTDFKKWGYKNINYYNADKFKIGEYEQSQGALSSWGGFGRMTADVAGQLVSTMGVGWIGGGILKGLGLLQKGAPALSYVTRGVGASQAMHAMNEEGIRNGINEKDRALLTLAAGGAMVIAEAAIGSFLKEKNLIDRVGPKGMQDVLAKSFQEAAQEEYKRVGAQIAGAVGHAAKQKIAEASAKSFAAKAVDKVKALLTSDMEGSTNRFVRALGAGKEEFGEEGLENVITQAEKALYDTYAGLTGKDVEKGKGQFGVGFGDLFDGFAENAIGGFLGGAMGGIISSKPLEDTKKYRAAAQIVGMSQKWEDVEEWAKKTWAAADFDNPFVTPNDEPITQYKDAYQGADGKMHTSDASGNAAVGKKSKNDVAYEAFMVQLRSMWDIKTRYGGLDQDVIDKVFGSDTELVTQTLTALRVNDEHKTDLAALEAQYQSAEAAGNPIAESLQTQINAKKKLIAENETAINKVLSGEHYADYIAEKAILANALNEDMNNRLFGKVLETGKGISDQERRALIDSVEAPTEATRKDAADRVQNVKQFLSQMRGEQKGIASATTEVQEQVDTLNSLINAKVNKQGEYEGLKFAGKDIKTEAERKGAIETLTSNLNTRFAEGNIASIGVKHRINQAGEYDTNTDLYEEFNQAKGSIIKQLNERLRGYLDPTTKSVFKAEYDSATGKFVAKEANIYDNPLDAFKEGGIFANQDTDAVRQYASKGVVAEQDEYGVTQAVRQHYTKKEAAEAHTTIDALTSKIEGFAEMSEDEQMQAEAEAVAQAEEAGRFSVIDANKMAEWESDVWVNPQELAGLSTKQGIAKISAYSAAERKSFKIATDGTQFTMPHKGIASAKKNILDAIAAQEGIEANSIATTDTENGFTAQWQNEKGETITRAIEFKNFDNRLFSFFDSIDKIVEQLERQTKDAQDNGVTKSHQTVLEETAKEVNRLRNVLSDMILLQDLGAKSKLLTDSQKAKIGLDLVETIDKTNTDLLGSYFGNATSALAVFRKVIEANIDVRAQKLAKYHREVARINAKLLLSLKKHVLKGEDYPKVDGVSEPDDVVLLGLENLDANAPFLKEHEIAVFKAQQYWYAYAQNPANKFSIGLDFYRALATSGGKLNGTFFGGKNGEYRRQGVTVSNDGLLSINGIDSVTKENFDIGLNTNILPGFENGRTKPKTSDNGDWNMRFVDMFLYNTFGADQGDFVSTFGLALKEMDINVLPNAQTQEQINTVQSMFSFFSAFNAEADVPVDTGLTYDKLNNKHIMAVLGPGGAGKTTFVVQTFLKTAKKKNPNARVILVTPYKSQGESLTKAAKQAGFDTPVYYTFQEFMAIKETFGKDDIIVMDECSLMKESDLANVLARNNQSATFLLGDPFQCPDNPTKGLSNEFYNLARFTALNMTQIMRADVTEVGMFQAALRSQIASPTSNFVAPTSSVYQDVLGADGKPTGEKRGVQDMNYETLKKAFVSRVEQLSKNKAEVLPTDIMMIVWTKEEKDKIIGEYPSIAGLGNLIKTIDGDDTPQGLTTLEAYVHLPQDYINKVCANKGIKSEQVVKTYARFVLTATSRPRMFLAHTLSEGKSVNGVAPKENGLEEAKRIKAKEILQKHYEEMLKEVKPLNVEKAPAKKKRGKKDKVAEAIRIANEAAAKAKAAKQKADAAKAEAVAAETEALKAAKAKAEEAASAVRNLNDLKAKVEAATKAAKAAAEKAEEAAKVASEKASTTKEKKAAKAIIQAAKRAESEAIAARKSADIAVQKAEKAVVVIQEAATIAAAKAAEAKAAADKAIAEADAAAVKEAAAIKKQQGATTAQAQAQPAPQKPDPAKTTTQQKADAQKAAQAQAEAAKQQAEKEAAEAAAAKDAEEQAQRAAAKAAADAKIQNNNTDDSLEEMPKDNTEEQPIENQIVSDQAAKKWEDMVAAAAIDKEVDSFEVEPMVKMGDFTMPLYQVPAISNSYANDANKHGKNIAAFNTATDTATLEYVNDFPIWEKNIKGDTRQVYEKNCWVLKNGDAIIGVWDLDIPGLEKTEKYTVSINPATAQKTYTTKIKGAAKPLSHMHPAADILGESVEYLATKYPPAVNVEYLQRQEGALPAGTTYIKVKVGTQEVKLPVRGRTLKESGDCEKKKILAKAIETLKSFIAFNPNATSMTEDANAQKALENIFQFFLGNQRVLNANYAATIGEYFGTKADGNNAKQLDIAAIIATGVTSGFDKTGKQVPENIPNVIRGLVGAIEAAINNEAIADSLYHQLSAGVNINANDVYPRAVIARGKLIVSNATPISKISDEEVDALFNKNLVAGDTFVGKEEAIEQLRDILGEASAQSMQTTGENYVDGDLVLGSVKNGTVFLTDLAGRGISQRTIWHEAMHVITEYMMPVNARKALMQEIWRKTKLTGKEAVEWIAVEAERFNAERRNIKGLSKLLRKFLDFFKYFVGNIFPFVKDQVHSIMYETYIKRAYQNAPMRKPQSPNEPLYNRVPEKLTASLAGSKTLALHALGRVSQEVSKLFLRATMDNQRVRNAHNGFNFIDLKNRVQYKLRENLQVLYLDMLKTDKTSLPPNSTKEVDANGNIISLVIDGLEVIRNGQPVHSAKVHEVMRELLVQKLGAYETRLTINGLPQETSLANLASFGQNGINAAGAIEIKTGLGTVITLKDVHEAYTLLQGNNLEEALSYSFPNIDFVNINNRKNGDLLSQMIAATDSIQALENHETSPLERQSDLIKMMLATIPVETKMYGNRRYLVPMAQPVEIDMFMMEVSDAALSDEILADSELDTAQRLQKGIEAYLNQAEADYRQAIADNKDLDRTPKHKVVKAMYGALFAPFSTAGKRGQISLLSVRTLSNQYEQAIASGDANIIAEANKAVAAFHAFHTNNGQDTNAASLETYKAQLIHLGRQSALMLNAVSAYYSSVAKDNYVLGTTTGVMQRLNSESEERVANSIKDGMASVLIQNDVVGRGFQRMFAMDKDPQNFGKMRGDHYNLALNGKDDKSPFEFETTVNSVDIYYYYDKTSKVKVASANKDGTITLHLKADTKMGTRSAFVEKALASLGISGLNRNSIGKLSSLTGTNGLAWFTKWYTLQISATAVGAYQLLKNKSIEALQKDSDTNLGIKVLDSFIENYETASKADVGAKAGSVDEIVNRTISEEEQAVGSNEGMDTTQQIQVRAGFFMWKTIDEMANVLHTTESNRFATMGRTPQGKAVYLHSIQDDTKTKYRGGSNNVLANAHSAERAKLIGKVDNPQAWGGLNESYDETGTPIVYNPLLTDMPAVVGIEYFLGVKLGYNNGVDITQMGEADNLDVADMFLAENVGSEAKVREGFKVQLHNQSDRGRQKVFTIRFSNAKNTNGVVSFNSKLGIRMDGRNLAVQTSNRFAMEENARFTSVLRWIQAFRYAQQSPIGQFSTNINKELAEAITAIEALIKSGDTYKNTAYWHKLSINAQSMQEIEALHTEYQRNMEEVTDIINKTLTTLNNTLKGSLETEKERFLQYSGLFSARDFLVVNGSMIAGVDTNMNSHIKVNVDGKEHKLKSPANRFSAWVMQKKSIKSIDADDKSLYSTGAMLWAIRANNDRAAALGAFDYKKFLVGIYKEDIDFEQTLALKNNVRSILLADNKEAGRKKYNKWKGKGLGGYGEKMNEMWIANTIATILFNDFNMMATAGSIASFEKGFIKIKPEDATMVAIDFHKTYNKRTGPASSPGLTAAIDEYNGMDVEAPYINMYPIYKEEPYRRWENGKLVVNNAGVKVFDGMSFELPFHMLMMEDAYGGSYGMGSANKTIIVNNNIENGSLDVIKHSSFTAYKHTQMDSPAWIETVELCMNPQRKTGYEGKSWTQLNGDASDNMYARYSILLNETRWNARKDALMRILTENYAANPSVNASRAEAILRKDVIETLAIDEAAKQELLARYFPVGISQRSAGDINAKDLYMLGKAILQKDLAFFAAMPNIANDVNATEELRKLNLHIEELNNVIEMMPIDLFGDVKEANIRLFHEYYKQERFKNRINGNHDVGKYYAAGIHSADTMKQETAARNQVGFLWFPEKITRTENDVETNVTTNSFKTMFKGTEVLPINKQPNLTYEELSSKYVWLDMSKTKNQLNANRDTDDTEESPLTQLMTIILSSPNYARRNELMNILSKYIEEGVKDLQLDILKDIVSANKIEELEKRVLEKESSYAEEFRKVTGEALDKEPIALKKALDSFLHEFANKRAAAGKDTSMLAELLQSPNVGANFGGMQMLVYRYVSAHIKSNAIKRKMSGMRLVQTSGNLIHVFDVKIGATYNEAKSAWEGGTTMPMTLRDLANHIVKMGWIKAEDLNYNELSGFMLELFTGLSNVNLSKYKNVALALESQIRTGLISKPRELKKFEVGEQQEDGSFGMNTGECVLPAAVYNKFGINDDIALQELYTIYTKDAEGNVVAENIFDTVPVKDADKRASFQETLTKGFLKPGANVMLDTNGRWIINPNGAVANNKLANQFFQKIFLRLIKKANTAIDNDTSSEKDTAKAAKAIRSAYDDVLYKKAMGKYIDALAGVKISIMGNLPVRTPSGPGSGSLVRCIGFHNDNGSIAYFNSMHTYINGSDYDVDQKTVYYADASNWAIGQKNAQRGLEDELFEELQKYYEDVANANFSLSITSTELLEDAGKEGGDAAFGGFNGAHNLGASVVMRNAAMGGKVVGPFANAQKGLTALHAAWKANGGHGFNTDLYNLRLHNFESLPKDNEMMVNGATDNAKIMSIGNLGIIFENTDMVSAEIACALGVDASNQIGSGADLVKYIQDSGAWEELGFASKEEVIEEENPLLSMFRFIRLSPASKDVYKRMTQAKRFSLGGQTKTLYHTVIQMMSESEEKQKEAEKKKITLDASIKSRELAAKAWLRQLYLALGKKDVSDEAIEALYVTFLTENGQVTKKSINTGLAALKKDTAEVMQANKEVIRGIAFDKLGFTEVDGDLNENDDASNDEVESNKNALGEYSADEVKDATTWGLIKSLRQHLLKDDAAAQEVIASQEVLNTIQSSINNFKFEMRRAEADTNRMKALDEKFSKRYMDDLTIIGKFAMLGDWTNRWTKIISINQGTKSDPYEQMRYNKNLEYMLGISMDKFYQLLEAYEKHKRLAGTAAMSPIAFVNEQAKTDTSLSLDSRKAFSFAQYAHRQHQGDVEWIEAVVGDPSDPNSYLNYKEQFHTIGETIGLLMGLPHVCSMIKTINILDTIEQGAFPKRMPIMTKLTNEILDECGIDIMSERQFIALENEIDNALMSNFFQSWKMQRYSKQVSDYLYKQNLGSRLWSGKLKSAADRNVFIAAFPDLVDAVKNNSEILELMRTNPDVSLFMEMLDTNETYNRVRYVSLKGMHDATEDLVQRLKSGLAAMPTEWRLMFSLYQLSKDGFKYNRGNFSKILGIDLFEDFSSYVLSMYEDNAFLTEMKESIKMQVLANSKGTIAKRARVGFYKGEGGKTIRYALPPMSRTGYAKYSVETKFPRKSKKFGTSTIPYLTENVQAENTLGFAYQGGIPLATLEFNGERGALQDNMLPAVSDKYKNLGLSMAAEFLFFDENGPMLLDTLKVDEKNKYSKRALASGAYRGNALNLKAPQTFVEVLNDAEWQAELVKIGKLLARTAAQGGEINIVNAQNYSAVFAAIDKSALSDKTKGEYKAKIVAQSTAYERFAKDAESGVAFKETAFTSALNARYAIKNPTAKPAIVPKSETKEKNEKIAEEALANQLAEEEWNLMYNIDGPNPQAAVANLNKLAQQKWVRLKNPSANKYQKAENGEYEYEVNNGDVVVRGDEALPIIRANIQNAYRLAYFKALRAKGVDLAFMQSLKGKQVSGQDNYFNAPQALADIANIYFSKEKEIADMGSLETRIGKDTGASIFDIIQKKYYINVNARNQYDFTFGNSIVETGLGAVQYEETAIGLGYRENLARALGDTKETPNASDAQMTKLAEILINLGEEFYQNGNTDISSTSPALIAFKAWHDTLKEEAQKALFFGLEENNFEQALLKAYTMKNAAEYDASQELVERHNAAFDKKGSEVNKQDYTIERKYGSPIKIGDALYFADGTVGRVRLTSDYESIYIQTDMGTVSKVTDKSRKIVYRIDRNLSRKTVDANKALYNEVTLEQAVNKGNMLSFLEDFIRKNFPADIEVKKVNNAWFISLDKTDPLYNQQDAAGFVYDGVIYINTDLADTGTVVHEFAHIFAFWLKENDPEAYAAAVNALKANSAFVQYVKMQDADASIDDSVLENELIPYFMQLEHYQKQYLTQADGNIKNAYKELSKDFASMFGSLENVSNNPTLDELSNKFYTEFNSNNPYTSEALRSNKSYLLWQKRVMRASASTAASPINLGNISTVVSAKLNSEALIKSNLTAKISKALVASDVYRGVVGVYDFKGLEGAARAKKLNEVVDAEKDFAVTMDNKYTDFLSSLNDGTKVLAETAYLRAASAAAVTNDKNMSNAEKVKTFTFYKNMFDKIGFNPKQDRAMSARTYAEQMGISSNGLDNSATVIVHDFGKPNERISVVNFSNMPLGFGVNSTLGIGLSDKVNKTVSLKQTIQDLNAFNNGLLIMMLQNAALASGKSPIRVEKVATVGVYAESPIVHFKEIQDLLPSIKAIGDSILNKSIEAGLKSALDNQALYNADIYSVDLMSRIRLYAKTEAQKISNPRDKGVVALNNIASLADEAESGDFSSEMALAKAVYNRIQYMREEVFQGDKERATESPEYLNLMKIYLELTERKYTTKLEDKSMRLDEKWLRTQDRMGGRVQDQVYNVIDNALRRAKNQLFPFVEQNKTFVEQINKTAHKLSFVTDQSAALFEPMFKKRTAKYNGQSIEVNTQEIHFDENDPETKAALADPNSGLTLTMVAYGKFIVDNMEQEFAKYLASQNERFYLRGHYKDDAESKKEIVATRALEDARSRMKRGMIPAITSRYTEALAKGNYKDSLDKFFQNGLFQDSPFDNYYQEKDDADGYYKLSSQFWSQFTSGDLYGGPQRLNLMGLSVDENGDLIVADMKTQEAITKNLENSFNYTMAASIRAREMKPAIQTINIANDYLKALQKQRGVNTEGLADQLSVYINRQIYGEMPEFGELALGNIVMNVDNTLGAIGQLSNLMHLSFAPVLAAKNLLSASIKGVMNGTINQLTDKITGNALNMYGASNISKAISLLSFNPDLVEAINKKHQIVSMSERDMISHFKNVATKFNMSDTDTAMLFHWYGEHYTQVIGALAQMDKEGVLDAYSLNDKKELVYDMKKDTRFFDQYGNKTPAADMLIRDIANSQKREGVHDYNLDGKEITLLSPYSQGDENRVKVLVQRFVGEVTDTQLKNHLSAFALPRAVMSMRTYLYNTLQYFWKNPSVEPMLGNRVIRKKADGKEEVVWDAPVAEGLLQTLAYSAKLLKNNYLDKGATERLALNPYQVRNLVSMGIFTSVVLSLYYLLGHLIDADDEDKQNTGELLVKWTVYGALQEQLSNVNPIAPYTELTQKSSVYIQQISNIFDVAKATFTIPTEMIGFTDKYDSLGAQLAAYTYTLSKNIPYATAYRNIHNLAESVWDDITTK